MSEIDSGNITVEGEVEPKLGDIVPTNFLDKASAELKAGYREVSISRNGKPFIIRIEHPSIADELRINREYTNKYNELIKDGSSLTKKELENELKKRKVITSLDEERVNQLTNSIKKIIEDYNLYLTSNNKPSQKKMDQLRSQYYELRDKLLEANRELNEHYINSIESIAEQYQSFLKMTLCIKDIDGKPIWASLEELLNEKYDRLFVSQCIQESQLFWSNISREILYDLPGVLEGLHRGGSLENLPEKSGK